MVLVPAVLAVFSLGLGREHAGAAAAESGWYPAHHSARWDCIVIHHSACEIGGARRFAAWHRARGWDELGYHFVIGNGSDTPDGRVEIGPRWAEQKHGAHCKTSDEYYNEHGIGICLVGNFDRHRPSAAQTRSLVRLVRFLSREADLLLAVLNPEPAFGATEYALARWMAAHTHCPRGPPREAGTCEPRCEGSPGSA